ncbi:hypothetical protein [Pseudomonas capeferrum]
MPDVSVEISETEALNQLINLDPQAETSKRHGMDGITVFTVVMTLAPLVIKGIVDIVNAQLAARKHVRVTVKGVEIRGVSEKTLHAIVDKALKADTER